MKEILLKDHLNNIRTKSSGRRAILNSTQIHTTISKENKKKLLDMGNGILNDGIDNYIKLGEKNYLSTKEILLQIATEIIRKYTEKPDEMKINEK